MIQPKDVVCVQAMAPTCKKKTVLPVIARSPRLHGSKVRLKGRGNPGNVFSRRGQEQVLYFPWSPTFREMTSWIAS